MVQGVEKVKLRNNYMFLRIFKDMFEKNSVDSQNLYSKEKLKSMISFAYGISDPRSIKSKIDFAILSKIILINSRGYEINKDIIEYFNKFVEDHKIDLEEMDLLGDLDG